MPRPPRIEYENALYHVMNRGRGRQFIFHSDDYYQAFLETIEEAFVRFGCVIHAYCLMGNHYHLLIETPFANLSRIMRHINGVYTQRYNRMKHTDGPLFRGRYKAIVVSQDEYFLRVSRYIHRNPVETKIPLVERLEEYPYSSYPAYVGVSNAPYWLEMSLTRELLGHKDKTVGYRQFVMQGSDEETVAFHQAGHIGAVFGSDNFKTWVFDELLPELAAERKDRVICPSLSIQTVCLTVAKFYQVDLGNICQSSRGVQYENEPRKVAMYFCQHATGATLRQVAEYFNHQHHRSASYATNQVRQRKRADRAFELKLQAISKMLLEDCC